METIFKKKLSQEEVLFLCIQIVPYIFYIYLIQIELGNNTAPDSFRYLWEFEKASSLAYFLNSSLSVRAIYTFAQNNIILISQIQLAFIAAVQLSFYSYFKNKERFHNIILATTLTLLFSSHHSKWLVNIAMSDSLFTSFNFLFLITICYISKANKPWQKIIILLIAVFFILSRNPAPYVVAFTVLLLFALKSFQDKLPVTLLAVIVCFSILSIKITNKFDTSTELNAAQNILLKVLPDKEKVQVFHEQYGMPLGTYVETCSGGTVNSLCFNYQRIQSGSTYTRNYRVTIDDFYFADWIRDKGMKSWQHYIFIQNPKESLQSFVRGYKSKFNSLFQKPPYVFQGEKYRTLPDVMDPFVFLGKLYLFLHIDNIYSLLAIIFFSLLLYCTSNFKKEFLLITIMLAEGLALFFIGFFGDTSAPRQVYPGLFTLYLGQLLFLYYTGKIIISNTYCYLTDKLCLVKL